MTPAIQINVTKERQFINYENVSLKSLASSVIPLFTGAFYGIQHWEVASQKNASKWHWVVAVLEFCPLVGIVAAIIDRLVYETIFKNNDEDRPINAKEPLERVFFEGPALATMNSTNYNRSTGLHNIGLSCSTNATLQMLFHSPILPRLLALGNHSVDEFLKNPNLPIELTEETLEKATIEEVRSKNLKPTPFWINRDKDNVKNNYFELVILLRNLYATYIKCANENNNEFSNELCKCQNALLRFANFDYTMCSTNFIAFLLRTLFIGDKIRSIRLALVKGALSQTDSRQEDTNAKSILRRFNEIPEMINGYVKLNTQKENAACIDVITKSIPLTFTTTQPSNAGNTPAPKYEAQMTPISMTILFNGHYIAFCKERDEQGQLVWKLYNDQSVQVVDLKEALRHMNASFNKEIEYNIQYQIEGAPI